MTGDTPTGEIAGRAFTRFSATLDRPLIRIVALALSYAALGWLGLQLAPPPGYASLIWPASGLAIAALTAFGLRAWPGVFLGSFFVNLLAGGETSLPAGVIAWINAITIAGGSSLQAVLSAYWIKAKAGYPLQLDGPAHAVRVVILAAPVACLVAATIGTASLYATGIVPPAAIVSHWLTWWSGDVGGVLIVLPLAFLGPWNRRTVKWRREMLAPFSTVAFVALLVLLGATLAAWRLNMQTAYERSLASFASLATDSQQALVNRMRSYRQTLDGGAALFEATGDVSLEEWRTYTSILELERTLPGISGIGFIEPVVPGGVDGFLRRAADRGVAGLRIHPETGRDEKFVILFIEPQDENIEAVGLDIAFEANRRRAAQTARDTGRATITERILLVQDETESPGFLLLRPFYHPGMPLETVSQRRTAFVGWIYAPFIAPRFMEGLTASQAKLFDIAVYDGASVDESRVIYSSSDAPRGARAPAYRVQRTFEVMGQPWTVVWASTPTFETGVRTREAALILVGGLILTLFFAILLLAGSRREAYTRRQVVERTRELEDTVAALAESERRFGDLAGLSPAGIFRTDPYGFCTYVNEAWLDVTGLEPSSALGSGWLEAVRPEVRQEVRRRWLAAIGEARELRMELQFARPDGSARWVDLLAAPQRGKQGEAQGFIAVAIDITEQKRAVDALRESEQRFQSLASLSPAGIFRTDAGGMCVYVNPAWCRMAGLAEEEALGAGWGKALHPDDIERVTQGWADAVEAQISYRVEFRWRHPDGTVVWVDALARPERDDEGVFRGYIGVVLDITDRKRFEKEIAERDEQLSLLAQNATDAVFRIDLEGRCIYASPSTLEVLGRPIEEFIGAQMLGRFHPEDEERMEGAFEALRSGQTDRVVVAYRSAEPAPEGEYRWFEAHAALLRDPESRQPREILASIRDISDRKKLELDLIEARRSAEAAAAAKATFLANMSHEIRTPMNGVIGFTDMLLDDELTPAQRRNAQLIADSGHAMMQILNDILDVSKIDAGQMTLAPAPVDLRHKLQSCMRLIEPGARQKSLRLSLCVDDEVPRFILADPLRLQQILSNLLGNAVKFTPSGSVRVHASVERPDAAGRPTLRIAIEDTGIGIPPDRLEAIFQEFSQGDESTARNFGGTGLGLTISSQLARLMGGELSAASETGKGAVFTLRIPLEETAAGGMAPAPAGTSETAHYGRVPRILVAEDHDINQELIVSMAGRLGLAVSVASNGEEAVHRVAEAEARGEPYDLVLMDIQMPVMDGLAATKTLRRNGYGPDRLPILALTANAYRDDVERCLAAGMQGHLAKPLKIRDLRETVGRWLPRGQDVEPQGPTAPPAPASLEDRYRRRKRETLEALYRMDPDAPPGRVELAGLAGALHKLAGTAGMFGEEGLGEIARAQEAAILSADDDGLGEAVRAAQTALAEWR